MAEQSNPFMARWGSSSDSDWLSALLLACSQPVVDGVAFPSMPDARTQTTIMGNSNEVAVRGSHQFYKVVRDIMSSHGITLEGGSKLLDFGTGWGRMIRPFLRHLDFKDLYAIEPSTEWCITARRCNPYVSIVQSELHPPLAFRANLFRYVIAYSIFTHLPESLFDSWMVEFERILVPGGVLAFTFLGDQTISQLIKYPSPLPPEKEIHFWHRILLESLAIHDPDWDRYRSNQFVFLPTGGPFYGDTFMSPALIRSKLTNRFDILEIDSDKLAQDLCLVRKRD
jgi:hypothetical protein